MGLGGVDAVGVHLGCFGEDAVGLFGAAVEVLGTGDVLEGCGEVDEDDGENDEGDGEVDGESEDRVLLRPELSEVYVVFLPDIRGTWNCIGE